MSASCVTEPLVLLTESDGALTLKKSCKTYSSNSALDTHLNTHTEEKSDNVRNPVVKILASCVTKPLVPMTISKDDLTLRKSIKTYSLDCAVNTHTKEKSNVKNPVVKMPSSCVTEPLVLLSVPEDNLTLKKSRKTYSSNFAHNIETEENSLDNVLCDSDLASTSDLNKQNITHVRGQQYVCEFCYQSFSRKIIYMQHLSIHTGLKPHVCDICGKDFKDIRDYKRHYRIHTGEKPYSCEFCGKDFNDRRNLKRHYLIHTGEKPYHCEICGKDFSFKGGLKRHQLNHPKKVPIARN